MHVDKNPNDEFFLTVSFGLARRILYSNGLLIFATDNFPLPGWTRDREELGVLEAIVLLKLIGALSKFLCRPHTALDADNTS